MEKREYQICVRCAMDTSDSKIVFDDEGVCDHCRNFDNNIKPEWNRMQQNPKKNIVYYVRVIRWTISDKKDCPFFLIKYI